MFRTGNILFCPSRIALLLLHAGGILARGSYFVAQSLFFNLFQTDFSHLNRGMLHFFHIFSCYLALCSLFLHFMIFRLGLLLIILLFS